MRGLLAAVSLLTRVPVGRAAWDDRDLTRSVVWLPVVGAVIGGTVAGAYTGLLLLFPDLAAAGVATTLGILLTGAFHEDGLADTFDAFGASRTREETLLIMKDPTHGSFGVIALVLSVVLRVIALATLTASTALLIVPAVHALSRAGAVSLMGLLPPAAPDGLGAAHSHPGLARTAVGVLAAIVTGLVLLGGWVVPFAVLAGVGVLIVGRLASQRISGFTGDVLGAVEQVVEVSLLLFGASLVHTELVSGAWWQ